MGGKVMRLLGAGAVALGLMSLGVVSSGGAVLAAPPGNDDVGNATEITSLPFSDTVDTTDATTTPEEAALNDFCGAPEMEHTVWYTATIDADGFALIDVTDSNYSAGIVVLEGSPGALMPVDCAAGTVAGAVEAGEQLYFMIFGDGLTEETSGSLQVEVRAAVPPPEIDVTIDQVAYVDRDGVATLTGTVTCTADNDEGTVFDVSGFVNQRVGRGSVDGFFFAELELSCDGTTTSWSALAFPEGGRFAGGKAATVTFAFGCGPDLCSDGYLEATVQMRKGRPR
jgi:hypothetical protein